MILCILYETPDIPHLVSPQKSYSPTWESLVLVLVSSQPGSATLLYSVQCPCQSKATPWSRMPHNAPFSSLESFTFKGIPLFYRVLKVLKDVKHFEPIKKLLHTHDYMLRPSVFRDGTHYDYIFISCLDLLWSFSVARTSLCSVYVGFD